MSWQSFPTQGSVKMWSHSQNVPATSWNIFHRMGVEPIVEVFIPDSTGSMTKAHPQAIIQVDVNTVEVRWSSPQSGKVTFVAPR